MEIKLGTTADQLAARVIGRDSQVPSMEIVLEKPTQIACDTSDCFFVNTISWRNPTTPNPAEAHPRIVFERLFGDGGSAAQRMARIATDRQHSGFGAAGSEPAARGRWGLGDRTKLTEYLDSVREIEQRIQSTEKKGASEPLELPDRPVDIPETFEEHAKLMFDLMALAYRADITRGVHDDHGAGAEFAHLSEHRSAGAASCGIASSQRSGADCEEAKIDAYHISLFNYFLEQLQNTPDGDGSLLGPQPDSLRRRHRQRQSARAHESAITDGAGAS